MKYNQNEWEMTWDLLLSLHVFLGLNSLSYSVSSPDSPFSILLYEFLLLAENYHSLAVSDAFLS